MTGKDLKGLDEFKQLFHASDGDWASSQDISDMLNALTENTIFYDTEYHVSIEPYINGYDGLEPEIIIRETSAEDLERIAERMNDTAAPLSDLLGDLSSGRAWRLPAQTLAYDKIIDGDFSPESAEHLIDVVAYRVYSLERCHDITYRIPDELMEVAEATRLRDSFSGGAVVIPADKVEALIDKTARNIANDDYIGRKTPPEAVAVLFESIESSQSEADPPTDNKVIGTVEITMADVKAAITAEAALWPEYSAATIARAVEQVACDVEHIDGLDFLQDRLQWVGFDQYLENNKSILDLSVKDWYCEKYPTDPVGKELNDIAFGNLISSIDSSHDSAAFYKAIGVGESDIRERIFAKLSDLLAVPYDVVYEEWLHGNGTFEGKNLAQIAEQVDNKTYVGSGETTRSAPTVAEKQQELSSRYEQPAKTPVEEKAIHKER